MKLSKLEVFVILFLMFIIVLIFYYIENDIKPKEATICFNKFVNVTDIEYGAIPNDGKDDTDAFEKAIKTGLDVYCPEGQYEISNLKFKYFVFYTINGGGILKTKLIK